MAGSLIKVDEFTISSPVASVILGGGSSGSSGLNASIDSTYDVYQVVFNNIVPSTDGSTPRMRVTESGTGNSTTNYDVAQKNLNSNATFGNGAVTNQTSFFGFANVGNFAGESSSCIMYLFNFNNASEYSFCTWEGTGVASNGTADGRQGGGVFTSSSFCDGVEIFFTSAIIASGTFTLYGLAK